MFFQTQSLQSKAQTKRSQKSKCFRRNATILLDNEERVFSWCLCHVCPATSTHLLVCYQCTSVSSVSAIHCRESVFLHSFYLLLVPPKPDKQTKMLVSQLYLQHVSVTTNLQKHKKTWRHYLIIMTSEFQIYDLLSHNEKRISLLLLLSCTLMNVRSSGGKHTRVQEQLNQHGTHEYKVMHQTQ